jgi:uncharacterized YccA/Bax inhibitor family protein
VSDQQRRAELIRSITLAAAELAFVVLIVRFVVLTFQAKSGTPPDLSSVQVDAAAGLAVVLGGGYSLVLGTATPPGEGESLTTSLRQVVGEKDLLFVGVIVYMLAGFAVCIAYASNEAETPAVLKTIAVAFGGYVVAYIGTAYKRLT